MKRGGRLRVEEWPCLLQASPSRTPPRALPASRTCPSLAWSAEAATTRRAVAAAAVTALAATPSPRAPCTTWATRARGPPGRSRPYLLQTSLPPLRLLLQRRSVRPGLAQVPVHAP